FEDGELVGVGGVDATEGAAGGVVGALGAAFHGLEGCCHRRLVHDAASGGGAGGQGVPGGGDVGDGSAGGVEVDADAGGGGGGLEQHPDLDVVDPWGQGQAEVG